MMNEHAGSTAASRSAAAVEGLYVAGEMADFGVIGVDSSLRITRVNRWLEAAADMSGDELVGRHLTDAFPSTRGTASEQAFRRALAGETVVFSHRFHRYLLPLPCPPVQVPYEWMQQSARILPVFDSGIVTGAVAVIHDVTERTAREDELRQAKEQAESASVAKSQFLAAMSHELRTPLSAVIGYADLLALDVSGPLTDKQRTHLSRIVASAWHLVGIIDEVLTFSRVEAGRQKLDLEDVDPARLLDDAVNTLAPLASEKKLALISSVPDAVPHIFTDPRRVLQILINLIGNAVKFTSEGSIRVTLRPMDDGLVFTVEDTGPGIPDAFLDTIFEPFTQVDQSPARPSNGTGLGLPVSRRLAELLGGTLTVETAPGEGSTFTLRLPRISRPVAADG